MSNPSYHTCEHDNQSSVPFHHDKGYGRDGTAPICHSYPMYVYGNGHHRTPADIRANIHDMMTYGAESTEPGDGLEVYEEMR